MSSNTDVTSDSSSIKKSTGLFCMSNSGSGVGGGGGVGGGKSRRYKCKKCDYVSNSKDDFWRHKGSHIKPGKVMPCTYPGCDFVTEYKHHLEYHRLNHFKVKPFSCKECNYTCVNKSMLNSHMKSHSSVYQFQCKDCNYATKYCHSLKQHLRKNKHTPSPVLNLDGSVNPYPIIDVYGTRRGPRPKKKSKSVSPSSSPKENQSSNANITSDLSLSSLSASPTNISSSFSQDRNLLSPPISSSSLKSIPLPPTSMSTIPSPVTSLLSSSPAILNGIGSNSNNTNNNNHSTTTTTNGIKHPHHHHPHHASISPNTINNNFDLNSNPFVHLLHLKQQQQQQQQHSLPSANSNKIPVQLTPPRLNRQKSTSPPIYGHKNHSTDKLSILNTNNNNNNNNNQHHHSNHHLHSNIVNGNNGPTLTNNIDTRTNSSNHYRDRCDDRSMVTSMDTSSLSPPPPPTSQSQSQSQPGPLTDHHPSFHQTSLLLSNNNKRPSSPITQNYQQQTNPLPFSTSILRNQNTIPPQFSSKSFADTLSRFSNLSNLTNRQDRLFSGQDLPPIHQFQDLSLFCPDSQTSTIDYIRNINIRMGVPFLCIPLFANDLLGPTVVGPNGLIRNIPGTGTPLQSSPDNNVSEEDYGEEDESSSDIEESFPLDLTRSNNNNNNNNTKSKPMPIIPPISTGRRDSKAVKFLID
ncbi:uncharacterized protein LOC141851336 [Brevipalpus obovatus]|uniref:uncharacterized protein LOC141851336 n=1 Tax=Brevipalpus obovatus TaxID=246614 RepID=UPI003D9F35B7